MKRLRTWCTAMAVLAAGAAHAADRVATPQAAGRHDTDCGAQGCARAPAVAPPAITRAVDDGGPAASAARASNLHQLRALDAFEVGGKGKVVSDVAIDLARYGITMRRRDGSYNTATNLTIRRVDIAAVEAPIYIRGGSHDILIEDARLHCTGTTSGIPGGIKIGKRETPPNYNITVRRAVITGCASQGRKGYPQGDGIATERPDHDITITDTTSTDHGDGCLDLKSSATRLDNVSVARCNWGVRLWMQGRAGTLRIGDVRKAAVQIKPSTDWTIDRLYLPPDPPPQGDIFSDGEGGHLAVGWCSRPVVVKGGPALLSLGPSCGR